MVLIHLKISVQITENGILEVGQRYSLNCTIPLLHKITAYQWRKDGEDIQKTSPVLSFSPLKLSDSGNYTCIITIDGQMYSINKTLVLKSKLECTCARYPEFIIIKSINIIHASQLLSFV